MVRVGLGLLLAAAALAGPVKAQELSFKFINPSFGGNPFYSDHLLGVATAQRPERPTEDSGLSEGEQFARQIQSRILSALSSSIVEAITGSDPGTSGEFTVGDQTIFFERTLNEIRLTITDNVTGEVTTIVLPVFEFGGNGSPFTPRGASGIPTPALAGAPQPSPESTLGGSLFGGGPLEGPSLFNAPPLTGLPGLRAGN
jgi:curli production assembly/transport component CsgF